MNIKKGSLIIIVLLISLTLGCTNKGSKDMNKESNFNNKNENAVNVSTNNTKDTKPKAISEEKAVELVKEYLSKSGFYLPPVIEVDGVDGDSYIVHAYEVITNEDESHIATMGWYNVNMNTGKLIDIMAN